MKSAVLSSIRFIAVALPRCSEVNRKVRLKKLAIVLAIGLILLPAGNVKATWLAGATITFDSPDDWDSFPAALVDLLQSMTIRWDVYQLDGVDTEPGGALEGANIVSSANFVTTFYIDGVTGPSNFFGVNEVSFRNVSLASWDPGNPGGSISGATHPGAVGVFDDNPSNFMYVGVSPETQGDPTDPGYIDMGALVAFGMSPPIKGGQGSDTGWLASEVNPLTTVNALCTVGVLFADEEAETYQIEVASIFGDSGEGCDGDDECDDGLFCNGVETCVASTCEAGTAPCDAGKCDEEADVCESEKVTICHIPPGNPDKAKTLSIGAGSVADHLAHGDYLGPCQ